MFFALSNQSDDKSIKAAAIGAFLGAIGAFLVSLFADRMATKRAKRKIESDRIDKYINSIVRAEGGLQDNLTTLIKNRELFRGFVKNAPQNQYSINLPHKMSIEKTLSDHFHNLDLANLWLSLCTETTLLNQLVKEFKDYYNNFRDVVRDLEIKGIKPVQWVVNEDVSTLVGLADVLNKATDRHIDKTLNVLACVTIHAKLSNYDLTSAKTLNDIKKITVPQQWKEKEIENYRERFNPDNLFHRVTNA